MLEQVSNALAFYAFFTESKVGKTGLTVTIDVWRVNTAGTPTEVVSAGSATEIGDGLYRYQLAAGSNTVEGEYLAVFKTATTSVDQQHIPALWTVQKAGVENLDAAISSRLATIGYTAPLDAAGTRSAVGLATANLDTQLAAIGSKTTNLPSDPADASDIAASFAAVSATLITINNHIDTEVAAIKAKTDNLPADPASESIATSNKEEVLEAITEDHNTLVYLSRPGLVPDDSIQNGIITAIRGDTFSQQITGLGSLVDVSEIIITAKRSTSDSDSAAVFRIALYPNDPEASGLLTILGQDASDSDHASIVVDDEDEGDITFSIHEDEMAMLGDDDSDEVYSKALPLPVGTYFYDVQRRIAGGNLKTVGWGTFRVVSEVTKST